MTAVPPSLSHLNIKSSSPNIILSQIFYFHLSNTMSSSLLTGPHWYNICSHTFCNITLWNIQLPYLALSGGHWNTTSPIERSSVPSHYDVRKKLTDFFLSAVFLRISIHRWYLYSFVEGPNKLLPTELTVQHRRASFLTTPLSCRPRKSCSLCSFHHLPVSDRIDRRQQPVHTAQASCAATILLPCNHLINKLNNLRRPRGKTQKIRVYAMLACVESLVT